MAGCTISSCYNESLRETIAKLETSDLARLRKMFTKNLCGATIAVSGRVVVV
jgi:hypothetical protein